MKRILPIQRFTPVRFTSSLMIGVMTSAALSPQVVSAADKVTPATKLAAETAGPKQIRETSEKKTSISTPAPKLESAGSFTPVPDKASGATLSGPVHVFDFRDPSTDELVRFSYQPSTPEELKKFSPSRARMITEGVPNKLGFSGHAKKFAVDFPPEYLAFTIAVGLSTMVHLDNDPAFVHNFVESNTSKEGIVSFAGFVAASRASHSLMQAFGMAYDPRRAPLDYRLHTPYIPGETKTLYFPDGAGEIQKMQMPSQGRYDYFNTKVVGTPMGPTRFQRNFAPLMGPIGLSAGMVTSNIIHEVMADPNLLLCVKAKKLKMVTVPKDPEQAKLMAAQVDEACDKAWEDWAFSKKMADYAPDLFSMSMASFIQAYLANPVLRYGAKGASWATGKAFTAGAGAAGVALAKNPYSGKLAVTAVKEGSEAAKVWVLRGLRIGGVTLSASPWGKLITTAGNIWLFMEIVHPITPLIKQPFERVRQGTVITSRINSVLGEIDRAETNKWVWAPRPDSDFCTGYEMDPMGAPTPNMNCFVPEQFAPSFLLKKMAERQAKWREFILADAYLAHKNWQTYVSEFAVNYANATAFYQQMFMHINYMRNAPPESKAQSLLYTARPFNGLYSDPAKRDMPSARKAVNDAAVWLQTYVDAAAVKAKAGMLTPATEKEFLPQILNGLKAMDPKNDLRALGSVEAKLANLEALNPQQRIEFESRVRERLIADAIRLLRKVLKEDPKYTDGRMQVNQPAYKRFAETNPFMNLRLMLGDPEPLAAGVSFIRGANDDQNVVEQSSKDNHPDRIGRIRTATMADYLTVSMVCGPEVDPRFSNTEKLQIYTDRKMSMFESLLDRFGLGTPMAKPSESDVMIAVNEYVEKSTRNDESYLRWFRPNAAGVEWSGFRAEFRPPRVVDGLPSYLCKDWAKNSNRDPKNLDYDPYDAKWTIDGKDYDGILDIIRQKARAEIVGTSLPPTDPNAVYEDPFSKWWTAKVDPNVKLMVAKFRTSFRSLLKDKYIPALTRNGVDGSVEYNGRSMKLGALESLYDETKLYLLIIGKTAQVTKDAAARKKFDDLSSSVVLEFKNVGQLATDLDSVEQQGAVANAAYETKRKALEAKLEDLKKFIEERQSVLKTTDEVAKVNEQTLKNLAGLMGEMDSYWGIVRSIQVDSH